MFGAHMSDRSTGSTSSCKAISALINKTTISCRMHQTRYRIAWALLIACILVTLFAVWAAAYRITELNHRGKAYTYATIVIQKGDTLWDIAVQYGPQGWDPRETIHHIAEVNQIAPASYAKLQPGDRIAVPISLNRTPTDDEQHVRVALERHSSFSE